MYYCAEQPASKNLLSTLSFTKFAISQTVWTNKPQLAPNGLTRLKSQRKQMSHKTVKMQLA